MEHCTRKGEPKILPECTLPLTGLGVVSRIITDLGVFDVTPGGLVLTELAPGVGLAEVRQKTGVPFTEACDPDRGVSIGRTGGPNGDGFFRLPERSARGRVGECWGSAGRWRGWP